MRTLLIDDLRQVLPEYGEVEVARTPDEGVKRLSEGGWELVLLDHDMGFDFLSGQFLEIWPCIEYIEQNADFFKDTNFYVVTSSPIGGDRMMQALESVGLTAYRIGYTEKTQIFGPSA